MFDVSFLPESRFEFVVITDTHHMLTSKGGDAEFTSRSKQSARAEVAIRLATAWNTDFAVHMGDLAQEYPETQWFEDAVREAQEVMSRHGLRPRLVPGNHDVGDKPDPTMPTKPVTAASLKAYHERCGPSWFSFDHQGAHFVVVNSQILSSNLPERNEQRQWLEQDLSRHNGKRIFMFSHLPPYLWDADEPGLGHYDNINQPDRRWLLELVRRHRIEMLFAAHVHWRFFDRIGPTRYLVVPSPSFTRPGFSHLFSSAAPPEQGRDDTPKMGFLVVRVFDDRVDTHTIRTNGMTALPEGIESNRSRFLVTCVSSGLKASPIGIVLRDVPVSVDHVPMAWPSAIRQTVRNDYPMLACGELGAAFLRTNGDVLDDPLQRRHLGMYRDEGLRVTAQSIWSDDQSIVEAIERYAAHVDAWELQIPGGMPSNAAMQIIQDVRERLNLPLSMSPILPNEIVEGKQHKRTRLGYRLKELVELDRLLSEANAKIDRVVCRVDANQSPWAFFLSLRDLPAFDSVLEFDVLVEFGSEDDQANAIRASEAMIGATFCPEVRIYFDPLLDMDRTMDVSHGLLDPMCNPRPVFHVMRCLNTILFSGSGADFDMHPMKESNLPLVCDQSRAFAMLLPNSDIKQRRNTLKVLKDWSPHSDLRVYWLADGIVGERTVDEVDMAFCERPIEQPVLLEIVRKSESR